MSLETALHVMQLTRPKIIFCSEKSTNVILNALKENNYNSKIAVFGYDYPIHSNIISFSDILNTYSDAEVANFRYIETDDIKETVCIMHSSGTTGMPKGVEISNYCLLLSDNEISDMIDIVSIWFSPLYWISGIIMYFKAITQGAKVIIYPEFDEEMTCLLIEKYKVREELTEKVATCNI